MNAVAYLRRSREGYLAPEDAVTPQRDLIRKWAADHGHRVVAEFVDDGVSGAVPAPDRPGLSAALDRTHHDPTVTALVVRDEDRLSRNLTVKETALALAWRRADVEVYEAVGNRVIPRDDPDDPTRTLIRQVMGAVAQWEGAMIRRRMRDGTRAGRAAGRWVGGRRPYGFVVTPDGERFRLVPDPAKAEVVARARQLHAAGHSLREVARELAELDPVTPWHATTVARLLQRGGTT